MTLSDSTNTAILLVSCPDQKGIVATVSDLLYAHGGNIVHADQHQDKQSAVLLMRFEWDLKDFDLDEVHLREQLSVISARFGMRWQLRYTGQRPALALLVSRYQHCLLDILQRHQLGELNCRIPLIISNHSDARSVAEFFGIAYHEIPVKAADKAKSEKLQLELLRQYSIDVIVLARYMQILSSSFVACYPERIINIHHSFLPAFSGSRPYHAAFTRGVKLVGATSHYVTDELDEGPIIEQEVIRVSHRDQVEHLIQKGRDLERIVLARAVRWHLENRILCYGNKTVVFD